MAALHSVTFSSPSNIAVIKYWGKRDAKHNLPLNSSVSVTMNQDDLCTTTTVVASKGFPTDRLWLNGNEENIERNKRIQSVLREIRALAETVTAEDGSIAIQKEEWSSVHFHIVSQNNFPTAAGMASSAAGYSCLVAALTKLCGVEERFDGQVTTIARKGSGSACRSLYGGFVRWNAGVLDDGTDSIAVQVAPETHWPELEMLILVVSAAEKDTGSTVGMEASAATSSLLQYRVSSVVPDRLSEIEAAYLAKDFESFGRITMQDSNQFHATCLDSFPPIFYMNDTSRDIIHLVHRINSASGFIKAAYTFDAGPNAVIFALHQHIPEVLSTILACYPPTTTEFVSKASVLEAAQTCPPVLSSDQIPIPKPGAVKFIYHTSVGDGPRELSSERSLANLTTGLPL